MSKRNNLVLFGAAGLLLTAPPAGARGKTPARPVQTAVIENSGSTNTVGYKITVSYYGNKCRVVTASLQDGKVGHDYVSTQKPLLLNTRKLFQDIAAAGPLAALPITHGVRSVSFGTSTTLIYKGQKSPDLTSARDPRAVALRGDVEAITRQVSVEGARHPFLTPPNPMQPEQVPIGVR